MSKKNEFREDLAKVDAWLSNVVSHPETLQSLLHCQLKTQAAKEFLRVTLANCLLMDRKQQDYGPKNIAKFMTYGCLVRLSDKVERLAHIYRGNRRRRAINESVVDSFRDSANYANIALLCELGRWPTEEEPKNGHNLPS